MACLPDPGLPDPGGDRDPCLPDPEDGDRLPDPEDGDRAPPPDFWLPVLPTFCTLWPVSPSDIECLCECRSEGGGDACRPEGGGDAMGL